MNDAEVGLAEVVPGEQGLVEWQDFVCTKPFTCEDGGILPGFTLRYETYGRLNAAKDNAILICHALSGDHHAAGVHSLSDKKPGWWNSMIGPGKPFDTNRFFIICSNCLGGCQGSTGPSSVNPKTGQPYRLDFPLVGIRDMVRAQKRLTDHLSLPSLYAVAGGSMGGMQVLQWMIEFPDYVQRALPMATSARQSAQAIAFNEVGRSAIMQDTQWAAGDYERGKGPNVGLAIARMMAHITYLSEEGLAEKFGRRFQDSETPRHGFGADFAVESYLNHQGEAFLTRFDALSYLYLTRVMDYFDAFADIDTDCPGDAFAAVQRAGTKSCVLSFDTDWRFDTGHSRRIAHVLERGRLPVTFREIPSVWGHDSFLLPIPAYHDTIRAFLERAREEVL